MPARGFSVCVRKYHMSNKEFALLSADARTQWQLCLSLTRNKKSHTHAHKRACVYILRPPTLLHTHAHTHGHLAVKALPLKNRSKKLLLLHHLMHRCDVLTFHLFQLFTSVLPHAPPLPHLPSV